MATAKKAAKKPAAKKPAAKKPAAKKPAAKKPAAKKAAPAKKKPAAKKPAAKKPAAKRKPNAAFMKAMTPSAVLAAVVGSTPMPRTEVTKKIWDYIKKNKLQDAGQPSPDQRRRQAEGRVRGQGQGFDVRDDEARLEPSEVTCRVASGSPFARSDGRPRGNVLVGRFVCAGDRGVRAANAAQRIAGAPPRPR